MRVFCETLGVSDSLLPRQAKAAEHGLLQQQLYIRHAGRQLTVHGSTWPFFQMKFICVGGGGQLPLLWKLTFRTLTQLLTLSYVHYLYHLSQEHTLKCNH